jgi:HK97 family phage major capsid protein
MIPSITASRGFVLRKVRGVFDACRLLVSSTGHRFSGGAAALARPSLLATVGVFAMILLPVLILLVASVAALHAGEIAGLSLAFPAVLATPTHKDGRAAEFRTKAEAIRTELLDSTKTFSKTEVETKAEEIRALEARAALVAEFTPEAEIERQGGDTEIRRANPDNEDASEDVKQYAGEMEKIAKRVAREFGGPNGYLRKLAERTKNADAMTTAQRKVHEMVAALQKRAIIGDSGGASGAEFLLPLQQVNTIFQVSNEQIGLVQYAQRYPVSGRTLRIPYLIQDSVAAEADGTGASSVTRPMAGIAAVTIVGEGDEKPERAPRFGQRLLTVYKWAAYTELGDETLGDDFTGDLSPTVQRAIGGQLMNGINESVTIDGTGASQPMGALHANNTALLTVNRETSISITTTDVFNMYAKHTFGGGQSFWLINRTALPMLMALSLSGNTLVTWLPNLTGAPTMMLLGLPVIMTDLTSVLGVKGDLALVNGGFYALAIRQALTVESSIHYKFRNDLTAFRFLARAGGIPIPTDTYAYKAPGGVKVAEHSPFVILGDDATS